MLLGVERIEIPYQSNEYADGPEPYPVEWIVERRSLSPTQGYCAGWQLDETGKLGRGAVTSSSAATKDVISKLVAVFFISFVGKLALSFCCLLAVRSSRTGLNAQPFQWLLGKSCI